MPGSCGKLEKLKIASENEIVVDKEFEKYLKITEDEFIIWTVFGDEIFLCYMYNRSSSWRDKGVFIT